MEISVIGVEPRGAPLSNVAGWRARANRECATAIAVNDQRLSVLDAAPGIRIEMGAPVRRPLSAVPRIETIIMFAVGNAVVLKPDPQTPVIGGAMFEAVFREAGLPEGLLQIVVGGAAPFEDDVLLLLHDVRSTRASTETKTNDRDPLRRADERTRGI